MGWDWNRKKVYGMGLELMVSKLNMKHYESREKLYLMHGMKLVFLLFSNFLLRESLWRSG